MKYRNEAGELFFLIWESTLKRSCKHQGNLHSRQTIIFRCLL